MALLLEQEKTTQNACMIVNGLIIIGAGPSSLALGAGLKRQGVPYTIIEKANCIASLWQNRTYDRLKLHLPKQFCQLPYKPFPESYPEYPTKNQFVDYLNSYADEFEITPRFNETVYSAKYDQTCGLWRIQTMSTGTDESKTNIQRGMETSGRNNSIITMEYVSKWIVVATGENAEKVEPEFEGLIKEFTGNVMHACEYKSGKPFEGKRVLVVGCGNTGMEVSFDLCNHNAIPFMVVRNSVHVLPREILGKSTFGIATQMLKWMSIKTVDKTLMIASRFILGDLEKYGIKKPSVGPLELKDKNGKTPVLDVGTAKKIISGEIKIVSTGIKQFTTNGVELDNGQFLELDCVILATGYRSNVPTWLEENDLFSDDGYPKTPYPNGWKGKKGLYAVGFTKRGLAGASFDAVRVADDISKLWKQSRFEVKV